MTDLIKYRGFELKPKVDFFRRPTKFIQVFKDEEFVTNLKATIDETKKVINFRLDEAPTLQNKREKTIKDIKALMSTICKIDRVLSEKGKFNMSLEFHELFPEDEE